MEGLIPFVLNALKRNSLHQHSLKSLSDSSRRSYHLLLGGSGDSFNGSSQRQTQSEFQPSCSRDFVEYPQSELEGVFIRSRSFNKDPSTTGNRVNQTLSHTNDEYLREEAHQKWL